MKPYYDEGGITLYHGDCRDVLAGVAGGDAVITDPPYNVGIEYGQAPRHPRPGRRFQHGARLVLGLEDLRDARVRQANHGADLPQRHPAGRGGAYRVVALLARVGVRLDDFAEFLLAHERKCKQDLTQREVASKVYDMSTTEQTKTYGAIYVTITKSGKPRFSSFSRGRLWPVSRQVAEASFAAGATIYRKQAGVSIWQESPELIAEGA